MSTDVARAVQFANPVTGEVLTLDAPDQDLGQYLADIREYKSVLNEHVAMVNRELLGRLDKSANWTRHLEGGLTLSAPSSEPSVEYDARSLWQALQQLADNGFITFEAADAAVESVITYKAKAAGIKRLAKVSAKLRDLIAEHSHEVEKTRYVSVKRAS